MSAQLKPIERFPPTTVQLWLARRIGADVSSLLNGAFMECEQLELERALREVIRARIVEGGLAEKVAGKRAATGVDESYAELFERMYFEPLDASNE